MSRNRKIVFVILIALLGIVGLFSLSNAQGYCYWDNWEMSAGPGWWNNTISDQYALSADQANRMNSIRTQAQEKTLPLQNQLHSLRVEMRGYASRYDVDSNKIKNYRNQIRDLEDQIADAHLNARDKINKVLTKEQRVYFNQGSYGWWDMDNGWWHMGREMVHNNSKMMGNWQRGGYCW